VTRNPNPSSGVAASLLCLAVSIGCAGSAMSVRDAGPIADAGAPEAKAQLQGITAAHNQARASVAPAASTPLPALQWSATVAATAQAWADRCVFEHSGGSYGENLYADTGQGDASAVVADWVAERASYDFSSNTCSGVCGHYTQVVWAKSLRLGCGVTRCTAHSPLGSGTWNLWVCNYDPPGNFIGQRPY
jgi:uncharacterized protein YkwD